MTYVAQTSTLPWPLSASSVTASSWSGCFTKRLKRQAVVSNQQVTGSTATRLCLSIEAFHKNSFTQNIKNNQQITNLQMANLRYTRHSLFFSNSKCIHSWWSDEKNTQIKVKCVPCNKGDIRASLGTRWGNVWAQRVSIWWGLGGLGISNNSCVSQCFL